MITNPVPSESIDFKKKCCDCGQFVPKLLWRPVDDKLGVLCYDCQSKYDYWTII